MKRFITLLLTVATILFCLFAFASCNDTPPADETVYYTVSFNLDGGAVTNKNLAEGLKVKENTVLDLSEYIPSKDGYTFVGYSDGTTTYESNATITVTADITLAAQWNKIETPNSYTVTFDLVGGTLANTEISATEGTVIDLSEYVPIKEGFTFNGWKNGESDVASDAKITLSENMTLVAQWMEIPVYYSVTFNTDGGIVEGKDLTAALQVKKDTVLALSDYIPEKNGYTFGGWKLGETVYQANDEITVTSNVELIAQWTAIPTYTVTFNANEGTLTNVSVTVMEGSSISFANYIPVREGYDFIGWKATNGTVYQSTDSFTVTETVSFTAEWSLAATDASKFVFTLSDDEQSYILSDLADGFDVTHVVVPGEYNGKPVTEIAANVFDYKSGIVSIDLSKCSSLKVIGSYNFFDCSDLTAVNLEGCSALEKISSSCFVKLTKLTTLNLKGLISLKEIGGQSFGYGGNQAEAMIPVEVLDFSECVSLEKIGNMSFWFLTEVKVLDFSNTKLNSIGNQFIKKCGSLETIKLPATLNPANIGYEFITDTPNLKVLTVDSLSLYFCSEDGVLYDVDKTTIYKYPAGSTATQYVAPATVKTVKSQAFHNATNLSVIDFTACILDSVEWGGFAGCSSATLKVSFNENSKHEDGTSVSLGRDWNQGVGGIEYLKVIDITFSGITYNSTVTTPTVTIQANATYGDAAIDVLVKLNGQTVSANGGFYTLDLAVGENTIEICAEHNGKTLSKTITITRVNGNPTVTTTLTNGVISWYGSTVDFVVTAKDAAGNALPSSAIEIQYNWGYGSYKQTEGVIMADNGDGTVSVKVSYDYYYDMFYIFGDTEITLTVIVKDGDLSVSESYTVDWKEDAPSLSVTTTLQNNATFTYDTPLNFTITAKGVSGNNLTSSSVTIKANWGYVDNTLGVSDGLTLTDNPDGTIGISIDFTQKADWGFFDWDDATIALTIIITEGNAEKTLNYTVNWIE